MIVQSWCHAGDVQWILEMPVENKKIERDDSILVRAQKKQIRKPESYLKQNTQHDQREGMELRGRNWRQNKTLDGCLVKAKCPGQHEDAEVMDSR